MTKELVLALVASLFTATSSVAQRLAAAPAPGEITFSWRLVVFLIRRPVWFFGILCMIAGFGFQLAALDAGDLSLVQPVIATELLFVFAYVALRRRHVVRTRDWLAAGGMAAGLGAFLFVAAPSGGQEHTTGSTWVLAGLATFGAAVVISAVAVVADRRRAPSPARKAALLAIAAGIGFGFVAAVVKELSTHISAGPAAVFSNWSPYVLLATGAAAMFLASNAFQAGPLAASQPGFTIMDPLVASLLGVTVFDEHIRHSPAALAGEAGALAVLLASVVLLSTSPLIQHQAIEVQDPVPAAAIVPGDSERPPGDAEPSVGPPALGRPVPAGVVERSPARPPGDAAPGRRAIDGPGSLCPRQRPAWRSRVTRRLARSPVAPGH